MEDVIYLYDEKRHLICLPYSEEKLHTMADNLGIGRHFFHKKSRNRSHYDVPVFMMADINKRALKIHHKQTVSILLHPELHELLMDKSICPTSVGHMGEHLMKGKMWWRVQGDDVTCNFCGSWHPKSFLEFLSKANDPMDTESMIELSDRRHKIYVTRDKVSNASDGAIKCYIVHLNQYITDNNRSADKLNVQLYDAFKASNDKFSIRLAIMREKLNNNLK